ncbi:MAG: D-alanyl-D-alanine carboxypeptidase family protein [Pseudomonadota bacterium]
MLIPLFLIAAGSAMAQLPSLPVPAPPQVDARSYILIDFQTGKVLAEHDADRVVPPASLTKLMTAYLVFTELRDGRLRLDEEVLVSERAWRMRGSKMFIEVGDRVRVEDLIRGVIVQSGNDASVALAEHIAGTEDAFALRMEQQARAMGLNNSQFRNATGMPAERHRVTARDVAKLSRRLIADFPEYYAIYSEREFKFGPIKKPQRNRNPLLGNFDGADGLKTGYTAAAGYCLAASAEREGQRLISVVMGTKSANARASASRALLNYGFRYYATHRLYGMGETIASVKVWKGEVDEVPLGVQQDLWITIPRGSYDRLQASTTVSERAIAPVDGGETLGQLQVMLDGETVVDTELYTLTPVPPGSFAKRTWDQVMMWFD